MGEMNYIIIEMDIIQWCREYDGPKFHAVFCDAPYHLTSITKRFGKKDSAPAKGGVYHRASSGFMGQVWDGGSLAFQPETWAALARHLHPGGFVASYGGSRSWHRLACAMEDAGLIMHPTIFMFWAYGSGFPKATRVKDNGQEVEGFEGHRYGLQAIKPAVEPIIIGQKPFEGRLVDNITRTGSGCWNIDGGRIGTASDMNPDDFDDSRRKAPKFNGLYNNGKVGEYRASPGAIPDGRWPSNFVLVHHPECVRVGVKEVSGSKQREARQPIEDKGCYGNGRVSGLGGFGDPTGHETIPDWRCHPDCPVKALGEMSGQGGPSGRLTGNEPSKPGSNVYQGGLRRKDWQAYDDSGTAARYFYQGHWAYEVYEQLASTDPVFYAPKASKKEREAGLSALPRETRHRHNTHPTVKPIALNQYLATLLLPPPQYSPRRILVPFAGVASEMIGCLLAGWEEITGVEITSKYIPIAQARLDWWVEQARWGHTDVEKILSFISAPGPDEEDYEQLGLGLF